jgi:hypothetical protein
MRYVVKTTNALLSGYSPRTAYIRLKSVSFASIILVQAAIGLFEFPLFQKEYQMVATAVKQFFEVQYWRAVAYRIAVRPKKQGEDCKSNCFKLAQAMDKRGVVYRVCHGWYIAEPHRWIQLHGVSIIEPSIPNPNYHAYKERKN